MSLDFANWVEKNYMHSKENHNSEAEQKKQLVKVLTENEAKITLTEQGRIKVTLTKHELLPKLSEVSGYFSGKKYQLALRRLEKKKTKKTEVAVPKKEVAPKNVEKASKDKRRNFDEGSDSDSDSSSSSSSSSDEEQEEATKKSGNMMDDSSSDSDSDSGSGSGSGSDSDDDFLSKRFKEKYDNEKLNTRGYKPSLPGGRRYIVFVGNLPFGFTKVDIKRLFEKAEVLSIRLPTDKATNLPKGFAFVEFGSGKDLTHALGFHKTELKGRKINVELTAGGGGNSKSRKLKIANKKQTLALERHAKMQKQRTKEAASEAAAPPANSGENDS